MQHYWEIGYNAFVGYYNYLVHEILHPGLNNYFYWLIFLSLLVWLLEIAVPWRKEQSAFRKDFWLDAFYMFFNFFLFSLIGYNALSLIAVELFNDFLGIFGTTNIVAIEIGHWPRLLQLFTLFIIRDFIQWNVHRLLHASPRLWQFHKVHHSVEEMGFAAHLRFHWMETIVYRSIEYIPLAMIGFSITDFFVVHIFTLLIGHLNHSNIYLPLGPLKYVFNNPQMHIWHHAYDLPSDRNKGVNFGLTLSIWDYLFGTAYIPYSGKNIKLGFTGLEQFPSKFWNQFTYGFKKEKKGTNI